MTGPAGGSAGAGTREGRERAAALAAALATFALGAASIVVVGTDGAAPPLTAAVVTSTTSTTATSTSVTTTTMTSTSTTGETTTSATSAPPSTTSPPPPLPLPSPQPLLPPPPPPPVVARVTAPFEGLGTWIDVLDWSPTYTAGRVSITPADVDVMAAHGVEVLFVQTARFNRPEDVLDPALLQQLIDRAHGHGMDVVAWYLPTFTDPATDLRRLLAAAELDVEAIAVDIESTALSDVALRNERLVQLGAELDRRLPRMPIGAIVLPPVATELLNPALWPDFPWRSLPASYDVVLPMGYWTNRTAESGWLDGERYTTRNVELVRELTGDASIPVHAVGGIANAATVSQVQGMVRACRSLRLVGCSMYDEATMRPDLWPPLLPLVTP